MTPMLVGRFSSRDRFFSAFDGEAGGEALPVSNLSDLVGDAGGLGRTARTLLTQLSREGNRKPPGGEGGSAQAGFIDAPVIAGRGGDDITECGVVCIDNLYRRGGRGGTGGIDDGTAGKGPVGGGRSSDGGVVDRDIALLRCRGEKPEAGTDSGFEGEVISGHTTVGGVEGSTRGEGIPEPDGVVIGNGGDEPCVTGDVGDDVEHTETEDSVSEGMYGAAPTAGRSAKTSTFRDGTTSDKRSERRLWASAGSFRTSGGNAARGPNVEARGVGSSSKLPGSLLATECEASVPSKDV